MGRTETILIIIIYCIGVPLLSGKIQIRIGGLISAVYKHNPIFLHDSNVADVITSFQYRTELFLETLPVPFFYSLILTDTLVQKLIRILAFCNN